MLEPKHLEKSDNLRLVRIDDLDFAIGALKFAQALRDGTAIERVALQRSPYEPFSR